MSEINDNTTMEGLEAQSFLARAKVHTIKASMLQKEAATILERPECKHVYGVNLTDGEFIMQAAYAFREETEVIFFDFCPKCAGCLPKC